MNSIFLSSYLRNLSRGSLLSRNDDEILGMFILETLDPCHLFGTVKETQHPTILSPNNDRFREADNGTEKSKYHIPETNLLSLQNPPHAVVSETSEAETIEWSQFFKPQGNSNVFHSHTTVRC